MGRSGDDAQIVTHLMAISSGNYQRQKIIQEIDSALDMAATSAPNNKILLKELQKLQNAFEGYNQFIDHHVETAMEFIEKTPMTERAVKRREAQNESLKNIYLKPSESSTNEGFTRASNIKKHE